jgi:hypothetical protein
MRRLITELAELDALFDRYAERFGRDQTPYRNHVYRIINLVAAQRPVNDQELRKLELAGFFHDAGIWLAGTFDYLGPSARLACHYLAEQGLQAWDNEIHAMIVHHHKITPSEHPPGSLVEAFRRADWIDVSLGLVRFGIPRSQLREINLRFPNAGFHQLLASLSARQLLTQPWRPLPMLRL